MDLQTQTEIEAAAFRRLRDHLRNRTDVQNIDMMNLPVFAATVSVDGIRKPPPIKVSNLTKPHHEKSFTDCRLMNGSANIS